MLLLDVDVDVECFQNGCVSLTAMLVMGPSIVIAPCC